MHLDAADLEVGFDDSDYGADVSPYPKHYFCGGSGGVQEGAEPQSPTQGSDPLKPYPSETFEKYPCVTAASSYRVQGIVSLSQLSRKRGRGEEPVAGEKCSVS